MTPSQLIFPPTTLLSIAIITSVLGQNVSEATSEVLLTFVRADYYMIGKPSVFSMECITDDDDVTFWREINGTAEEIEVCLF